MHQLFVQTPLVNGRWLWMKIQWADYRTGMNAAELSVCLSVTHCEMKLKQNAETAWNSFRLVSASLAYSSTCKQIS